jgi:hypothetical protein
VGRQFQDPALSGCRHPVTSRFLGDFEFYWRNSPDSPFPRAKRASCRLQNAAYPPCWPVLARE